ncbi:MAG: galactokinase [Granulosicoccus sp.]
MNASDTSLIKTLRQRFVDHFGHQDADIAVFFAPGRVNLIGEYTDFTGGLVFPCAINQGTFLLIRKTGNHQYRFLSTNFDQVATLEQNKLFEPGENTWVNYPLGVLEQFSQRGCVLDGFDFLYSGNVPNGAGLSSSASIEVVTAFAMNTLLQTDLANSEIARIAQRAENEFVGMQCGIMDQFAVAMGKAGHALQLNCNTLEYRHVPLNLTDLVIVIGNTNQRRELNDSAYNQRVLECEKALEILAPLLGITSLGQLTPEQLNQHEAAFHGHPVALGRARHICEENARVMAAVSALEAGDIGQFGKLMNASHDSLRDLFEVSSEPLNQLVNLAREQPGVLGSRLTGAGFGGCTVSILPGTAVADFTKHVGSRYKQATGLDADFYVVEASDGVKQVHGIAS